MVQCGGTGAEGAANGCDGFATGCGTNEYVALNKGLVGAFEAFQGHWCWQAKGLCGGFTYRGVYYSKIEVRHGWLPCFAFGLLDANRPTG